eukprot:gene972-1237_t
MAPPETHEDGVGMTEFAPSSSPSTSSGLSSGGKKNGMYVTAKNLTVKVGSEKKKNERTILEDLNFFLKPGSMVLMLGSPGCGKTSVFKALAHQTHDEKISGSLLFNGRPADSDTHHRDVSYVVQDDHHMAPFTVRETFKFSADMQMKEGTTEKEKEERVNQILDTLGLVKQADTVVGNEFLRVALLQPGVEITKLFDFLMILSEGRMAYFGPMESAIDYFEGLGFKLPSHHNPAEFFQEIVDEPELYYEGEGEPPLRGSEAFAEAYKKSEIYRQIVQDLETNVPHPSEYKDSVGLPKYPTGLQYQIHLTSMRAFKMLISNPVVVRMRIIKSIVMGLILGSLYWNLSSSQADGNNRSGLIFFSLLFVIFGGMGAITILFEQREVFYIQKDGKYYRTFSFFLSLIFSELPISSLETVIFTVLVYWMCGLQANAEKFIYFLLQVLVSDLASQSFFKMVSTFSPNATIASVLAPAIMAPFILFAGFMTPRPSIPGWWIWVHWISPIKYGFEGLMSNEHHGMKYTCTNDEYVPPMSIDAYAHVCPINNGDQFLDNLGMPQNNWFKWIDLLIVFCFACLWSILMYFFLKHVHYDARASNPESDKKAKKRALKKLKKEQSIKEHKIRVKSGKVAKVKKEIPIGCYMQWKNLVYEVDIKKDGKRQRLRLLNEINGYVKPGMLLALMGPSGAGKSTLLDVLANRKTGGHIYGDILINGAPRTQYFTRTSAYVEQLDVLPPTQTVREAIQFSARTRLPEDMPIEEKLAFVENILETLNLKKIGDQQIGQGEQGLSLSQRKLVLNYFEKYGLLCDPLKNPADFILDVTDEAIDVTVGGEQTVFHPVEAFKTSELNSDLMAKINEGVMPVGTPVATFKGKYSSSIATQFNVLFKRQWLAQVRRVTNIRTRIVRSLALGIILGTLFIRMDNEQDEIYNRVSLLFFSLLFGGMSGNGSIPIVTTERGVFYREQASGMYRIWVYLMAFIITDLPWIFASALCFTIPMYFLTGLHLGTNGEAFFYHVFISMASYLNFAMLAYVLASVLPTDEIAHALAGVCLSIASLFAGFMIPPGSIPQGWKWFYHLDFVKYSLEIFLVNEFQDIKFECTNNKGAVMVPINETTSIPICPVTAGQQVLDRYEMKNSNLYINITEVFAYSIFFMICVYIAFRFIRHQTK